MCVGQSIKSSLPNIHPTSRCPLLDPQVTNRRSDRSPIARIGCLTMWDFIPSWTCAPCCRLDTTEPLSRLHYLGGGNSNIFFSPRKLGKIPNFDEHIFQRGWNHQLVTLPETHRSSSHLLKCDFWRRILDPELRRIQVKDFKDVYLNWPDIRTPEVGVTFMIAISGGIVIVLRVGKRIDPSIPDCQNQIRCVI